MTSHLATLSPGCVTAIYTSQALPQHQGNPLIEALVPTLPDAELLETLAWKPEITDFDRTRPTSERLTLMLQLRGFLVPTDEHISIVRMMESYIREGYVPRNPRSGGQAEIAQKLYAARKAGKKIRREAGLPMTQLSATLLGTSGMGKTTFIRAYFEQLSEVIYHPDYHLYQVPVIIVEMSSNGSSIKGVAEGIFRRLDELIPGANYYQEYALKRYPSDGTKLISAMMLLNIHCVGLLVIDEIQNIKNSPKGGPVAMTELVTASNTSKIPLLLMGTPAAVPILSLEFRQARRSAGYALAFWDRLPEMVARGGVNEWREFMQILWSLQWVLHPVLLDEYLLSTMYRCCQGIKGVAIVLFAGVQARVMLDGTERITVETIKSVYLRELVFIHDAIEALEKGDDDEAQKALSDIRSPDLFEFMAKFERQARTEQSTLSTVTSLDAKFEEQITNQLLDMKVPPKDAVAAAATAKKSQRAINLADGMKVAIDFLKPPQRLRNSKSKTKTQRDDRSPAITNPRDYRSAMANAKKRGTTTLEEMKATGMAPRLEDLLDLS
jgi:hypothetical protein